MKKYFLAFIGIYSLVFGSPAYAKDFTVGYFSNDELQLMGAQCEFQDKTGVILKSKGNTLWIKINGKVVEFQGEAKLTEKAWIQSFHTDGTTLILLLTRLQTGYEMVSMTGTITIEHAGHRKKFKVTGHCGA